MLFRRAIRGFRRPVGAPLRRARRASHLSVHPRFRPEFSRVNAQAGNAVAAYAPGTPDSVDLPPDAAARVFSWATPGVEVLVY